MIYRQGRWELSIYDTVSLLLRTDDRAVAIGGLTRVDLENLEAMIVEHNRNMRAKVQSGRCPYCGHHAHTTQVCPEDGCECFAGRPSGITCPHGCGHVHNLDFDGRNIGCSVEGCKCEGQRGVWM